MTKTITGPTDEAVIHAVRNAHPCIGNCELHRGTPSKSGRYTSVSITVTAPETTIKLIGRTYQSGDKELNAYQMAADYTLHIPQIYHMDADQGFLLMEDLNEGYVQGNHFNEDSANGIFIRENHKTLLRAAAEYHAAFWENHNAFGWVGLDWRLENRENLLAHIKGMEKDFLKYRSTEEQGKIPKAWNIFTNHISPDKLNHFQTAIDMLREQYAGLLDGRFHTGKNITMIHGDLHPGNAFISKTTKTVKFIDMEAVRMGICTEDLAMLLALHIEPEKERALPLLTYYHDCLCETVKDYPFEVLLSDYQISIMENMFFTVRLINRGIYDFSMRDRAIRAFEAFVLDAK